MKKLGVALTVVVFLVGLGVPALAHPDPGYHEVYAWVEGRWVLTKDCEMYSKLSKTLQYRWESDEAAVPCYPDYLPPHPEAVTQFDIYNYAHLFPWIDAHISETHLTWDIFKPGDYMAKTFIIQIQANCDVLIHLGGGTWEIPTAFEGGPQDGHIVFGEFTKDDEDELIGDKVRQYSLLCKDSEGTPPDEIVVRLWCYIAKDKPPAHEITDAEFGMMPPKADWLLARDSNCTSISIPECEQLHYEDTNVVFFEDLEVERCDSEGKYLDVFAVTITPDP